MLAIVTCGPAWVPIDHVRRITNFSTGEIGTVLADALADRGWDVVCFRGEGATFPRFPHRAEVIPFATNQELEERLSLVSRCDAFFHAAALSDYRVAEVRVNEVEVGDSQKLSGSQAVSIRLEPVPKVLDLLPARYPQAAIVGWKYELEGSREDAVAKAVNQLERTKIAATVINGCAFGEGFGLVRPNQDMVCLRDKNALSACLADWVSRLPHLV